jgi:hypothetical protein
VETLYPNWRGRSRERENDNGVELHQEQTSIRGFFEALNNRQPDAFDRLYHA